MVSHPPSSEFQSPGVLRRLAALLYDSLLLLALWVLASLPYLALTGNTGNGGPARFGFQLYLTGIAVVFFGWFWVHGGQTLGMRAWRLRLVGKDGGPVDWKQAVTRLGAALLSAIPMGLGYVWVLFDPERLAWHDRLSATRLILLPKNPRPQ